MKANELQIGDYVNYRGQIIKVTSLYDKGGSNEVGWSEKESVWVNADNVEPIPLTSKILEKNGFKVTRNISSSRNKDVWSLHVSKYKIFYITEHHNKKMFPYFWIEIGSNSDIKYVHQLQHALRLCEIEKEIVL